MKLEMHLFDDYKAASITYLRRLIANGLRVKGFPQGEIPDDEWFNANGLDYVFEYFHRRIPTHPREVRVCSHFCCPEDLKDEYLKIVDDIKDAMKSHDNTKRDCLRSIVSEIKN